MISATSRQPTATSLPLEEQQPASSSLDEPPDRKTGDSYSLSTPISMQPHRVTISTSKSSSHLEASTSPTVAYSPFMADSTGGSASDYEHELDSPSSLSSWNSWAGGRRGDLADVEDLELDGMIGGEQPELETVSELDEESSGFYSGSDRAGLDSDDEIRHQKLNAIGLGLDGTIPRRKNVRVGGHFNEISHNHHVHHASNQHHYHHPSAHHSYGPPSFPHFSPRAGGHGLSHASRHTLRAPPNLAARRRKGRIAELAEEGGGENINTTIMPGKNLASRREKDSSNVEEGKVIEQEDPAPSQTETEADHAEAAGDAFSPSTPTLHSSNHAWNEFEFIGPPPLPTRCVSPSETVPVVPSPLCVCLNAEEQAGMEEKLTIPSETIIKGIADEQVEETVTTPLSNRSGNSYPGFHAGTSTPSTSPAPSPQLVRKSSRGRRSSSPGRSKPRIPLRPCFRRRTSAQVGSKSQSEYSSETESESSSFRGRIKVRFSEAPPTEVRTHSPVEYDRKACPVSNRLSPSDVEELREMKMGLGLLEAKWAAMAACKTESGGEEDSETDNATTPKFLLPPTSQPLGERKRAESISSSSPTRFCKDKIFARDSQVSPADHLRIEREKERERACRLAGIGTGIGFRYSGGGSPSARQLHHGGSKTPGACSSMSLISRFGLSKPPPPLPGLGYPTQCKSPYEGGTSLHRPSSAPPIRSSPMMTPEHSPELDRKLKETAEMDKDGDDSRGRSFDKNSSRTLSSSTSTDRTETESGPSTPASIPELKHTSPSPDSSPERLHTLASSSSPSPSHLESAPKTTRPRIHPYQPPISPTTSFPLSSSACGYDSPASEFYESGSEYDLIG